MLQDTDAFPSELGRNAAELGLCLKKDSFAPEAANQGCLPSDEGTQSGNGLADDQRIHFPGALSDASWPMSNLGERPLAVVQYAICV